MWRLWCATCGWAEPGDRIVCQHQRQMITVAPDLESHALAMALDLADVLHNRPVSKWLRGEVAAELLDHDMWRVR